MFRLPRLSVAKLDNTSLSALSGNADDKGGGRNSGHRRRQSLMGRTLAQNLLPPGEWRIVAESAGGESAGRPVVLGPDGMPGPDLSISHSGQWVAAAMAQEGRIGIDVETPRAGRNCLGMAQAYFSQAECNVVEAEGQPALLAFWTMREAIAKALDWFEQGMDFADALHLATAQDCTGMLTFDRDFIKTAARIGAGNVSEP